MRRFALAKSVFAVGLVTVALGGFAGIALADHWHTFKGRYHGLEHGSSTTDGYFFGRMNPYWAGDNTYCGVGDGIRGVNYYTSAVGQLCSVWTGAYYVRADECQGIANVAADDPQGGTTNDISWHLHIRHNSSPSSCDRVLS